MRFNASIISVFALLITFNSFAQDPCTYISYSKKGAYWVFATFYQPNTQFKLEGVCEKLNNGKPYLYRAFKSGRLIKEIIYWASNNSTRNQLMSTLEIYNKRRDSIIGEFKQYSETGALLLHERYFFNVNMRRCVHRKSFHNNGSLRFDQFFAWVKMEELTDYQKPNHPPHTIDEEGYSYLQVPFGREQTFDNNEILLEEKHHQMLLDGSHEFASLHGPLKRFYDNGKLKQSCQYKNGKLHGEWIEYNYLGQILSEGTYDNGIKDGVWSYKYDNGSIKGIHQYNIKGKYPFQARKKEWSSDGQLLLWLDFNEEGAGFLKEWSDKGALLHEQQLVNMSIDKGSETFWFPNGQLKSIMNHRDKADTTYHEWYESGREKVLKRNFENGGVKTTFIKEWYANGNPQAMVEIQKGSDLSVFSQQKYFENGNLSYVDFRKNRERFIEEYANNGIKIRALMLLDNKLFGRYQELDSTGKILLDINYQNGMRHGSYKFYGPDGQLKYEATYENGNLKPKDKKQVSYVLLFKQLNQKSKAAYQSQAYALMNQQLYQQTPLEMSFEQIDSIAAVLWQLQRVAPNYKYWLTSSIGKQVLQIRLIESYFKDLKTDKIWTDYSKELLSGLTKLKVQLPSFSFLQGEANVKIELKNWINLSALKQLFPSINSLMQLTNMSEGNDGHKMPYPRYTIERKNSAYWKINLPIENRQYYILMYDDGTVEIENQEISWSAFLEADLEYRDKFHPWDSE
ncbi:MAG: toxin-antitoxin system YwqK family antitoxin [Bacteroidota bacterium]|jgi:antitoxin component YwqK of YwqJK toxin-antitoxin module